jgi:arginine/lysine/histidine/glutamine transport system substrate-binding and permease protein
LRTLKCSLLITSLALLSMHCGDNKPKPDAWKSITKNKFVRIATSPFTVPFESASGTGLEGFDIDLGEAIAKDIGQPTKWIKVTESYEKLFEDLEIGGVELIISAVPITPEKQKKFAFSTPYFQGNNTIARRQDNEDIKDLASLAGKRVGVQTGRIADQFMTNQKTAADVKLSRYQTLEEALGYLNRQEIDAVVGDKQVMTYSIVKNYSTNLIITGVELEPTRYAVVVRPEETKLLSIVNETINKLKSANELQAWHDKWFGKVLIDVDKDLAKKAEIERLKNAPKTLSVQFIKEAGNPLKLDRLDGFNATIAGSGGTFTSTAITTDDAGVKGSCRFATPLPPGDYTFSLSRLSVSQKITIAKEAKTALNAILTFTRAGTLVIDVK